MRTLAVLLIAVVLAARPVVAQEQQAAQAGFASGGFGAPVLKFSQMVDQFATFAGVRGGWVANHRFVVGGGVYALVNTIDTPDLVEPISKFIYAGLELEYIGVYTSPVHYSFLVFAGAGRRWRTDEPDPDHDEVWIIEPALNLELAPATFLRVGVGAGYRFVGRVTSGDTTNGDLSAAFGALTLKLGSF
jgi:hypothetical protein